MDLPGISGLRADQNPFLARSVALDRLLYGPPTKRFTVRIGFYLILTLCGMTCCIALIALVLVDRRRQQTPERLWIFKRAKRGEGTWVITNIKLQVPLGLLAGMCGGLTFTGIAYKVFKYHGSQDGIGGWRMGMTIPFHIGGWMLSYGSLSSYLITRSGNPHWILTPRVINTFFISLGILSTLAQLGLVIYEGILWSATIKVWQLAMAELATLSNRWDSGARPSVDVFDLGVYAKFVTLIDRFQIFSAASYGIMMMFAFIIVLINFCFLALIYTVRLQIAMKVSGMGSHHWTSTSSTSKSSSSIPSKPRTRKQSVSRSAVRELASSDGGLASAMQQARDIQGLQRAELDLAIVACMVVIIGVGGLGVYLKIVILCATKTYFSQIWPITELVLFTPVWGWAGATCLIVPLLILNTWFNMPGTLPGQRRPTLTPRTVSQGEPLETAVEQEEDLEVADGGLSGGEAPVWNTAVWAKD